VAEVRRHLPYPPDAVFAALSDPTTYPRWVVGAQRIRAVEGPWPQPGSAFHHVVGVWPLRLRDSTEVVEVTPGTRLLLEARARPAGRAEVELELRPVADGTEVVMREAPLTGPAVLVPRPLLDPVTRRRNERSLARLHRVVRDREALA
jgi:uncharacterized protein YndB with AHSA1/START domain